MAKQEDEIGLKGEAQKGGMPSFGGPTFSETDDIAPPTPNIVKTTPAIVGKTGGTRG